MAALSCTLASDELMHSSNTRPSICWYSAGRLRNSWQQQVRRLVNSLLHTGEVLHWVVSMCSMRYGPLSVWSAFSPRISSIGHSDSVLLDSMIRLSTIFSSYTSQGNNVLLTSQILSSSRATLVIVMFYLQTANDFMTKTSRTVFEMQTCGFFPAVCFGISKVCGFWVLICGLWMAKCTPLCRCLGPSYIQYN